MICYTFWSVDLGRSLSIRQIEIVDALVEPISSFPCMRPLYFRSIARNEQVHHEPKWMYHAPCSKSRWNHRNAVAKYVIICVRDGENQIEHFVRYEIMILFFTNVICCCNEIISTLAKSTSYFSSLKWNEKQCNNQIYRPGLLPGMCGIDVGCDSSLKQLSQRCSIIAKFLTRSHIT